MKKPVYYYFGINRGKKLFSITEPIMIRNNTVTLANNDCDGGLFYMREPNLRKLIDEYQYHMDSLHCYSSDRNKVSKFLSYGKLLSPDKQNKLLSVFCLDSEQIVLLKLNKVITSMGRTKREIWKLIKPLKLVTKEAFDKSTANWEYDPEYCYTTFFVEIENLKLSFASMHNLIISLYTKNYKQLRAKVKKLV